ncbi:hypothetical protein FJZ36_04615 [Candidatus Poribacteria bacterium]|nr:hypothetical protein [Candidatus Poribacteria bacterium]
MTSRERQLAAIRHEIPDRIPADAIAIENVPAIAAHLGVEPGAAVERLGLDGRIVSAPYVGVVKPPEDGFGFTEWGTPSTGDYGAWRNNPLASAASIADIERHPVPNPDDYDYSRSAEVARSIGDSRAVRGPYWKPLFCQVCDLFGMEEAMARMLHEPALFEAALERVFEHIAGFCERILDACGDDMPILCLGDDFATQRGLMISPSHWRRFLKPRFAKLFDIGKRRGKLVWFHSCGDISAILPDLIEIGADLWETVQLHTLPMTPERLKREYGADIAFFGGINTQNLPFTTPERVADEVRRCIDVLGTQGGYICGPDHHIKPDVPPENALALFDAIHAYRREGHTTLAPN